MSIDTNGLIVKAVNSPTDDRDPTNPAMSPWGDVEVTLTNKKDPNDEIIVVLVSRKHPTKGKGQYLKDVKIKDCD